MSKKTNIKHGNRPTSSAPVRPIQTGLETDGKTIVHPAVTETSEYSRELSEFRVRLDKAKQKKAMAEQAKTGGAKQADAATSAQHQAKPGVADAESQKAAEGEAQPAPAPPPTSPNQPDELDTAEKKLLADCEADIERNDPGGFVLGDRLSQIREKKLYRATHTTFQDYCVARWDYSKSHANRLIKGFRCYQGLKTQTQGKVYVPIKESQIRCIVGLKEEQQEEVAKAVFASVGDKRATAADFLAAKEKLFPRPQRKNETTQPANVAADENPETADVLVKVKFGTNLVPLTDLKKRADELYHIFANPSRKQDGLGLIGQLQRELEKWAAWQVEQIKLSESA